jgi:DNA-binding GntR family transcriptional regulator
VPSRPGRPVRRPTSPLVARLSPLRDSWTQRAVLAELRRVILAGDAPPGTPVPLDDVAAVLGVSVIPVRESLKILVGEGLVEQHERAAYTVARLARSELLELYTARGVLESAVLQVAVAVAGPADDADVRAAHALLEDAVREHDQRAYHRESRAFHLALLAPARMRRFGTMVESAWNLTESYRPMEQVPDAVRHQLQIDHRDLLEAFLARDVERLLACTKAHQARLCEVVAALPAELFADEPTTGRPPCGSP